MTLLATLYTFTSIYHLASAFALCSNSIHPHLCNGAYQKSCNKEINRHTKGRYRDSFIAIRRPRIIDTFLFYTNSLSDNHGSFNEIEQRRIDKVNNETAADKNSSLYLMKRRKRKPAIPVNPNPYNIPSDTEKRWEFFYDLLVAFFKENGHANVESGPKVNQSLLRNWMAEQRRSYMKTLGIISQEEDSKGVVPLTMEKKKRLDDAGFNWGRFGDIDVEKVLENNLKLAVNPEKDEKWMPMLDELKVYKKEYGDCDVPFNYKRNPKLGRWVDKQRRLIHIMPNRRRAILDQLGFVWYDKYNIESRGEKRVLWSERLEELKLYKREHGNCNVPLEYNDNPKLGEWVHGQRKAYKLWKSGGKAPMNEKRVLALERIGFEWNI